MTRMYQTPLQLAAKHKLGNFIIGVAKLNKEHRSTTTDL